MSWLKWAVQNALRRRLRTLLTLTGVGVGVAALFALLTFQRGYQNGMQAELERLGAHILVVPKGCPYDAASIALHGANWPCYLKNVDVQTMAHTNGVAACAPLLMNAVQDSTTGVQAVYVGAEPSLLALKPGWHIQGRFPAASGDCLIGASWARTHQVTEGQTFGLPGLPGQSARVCGVLKPTQGADDTFCFVTLARAQTLFHRPGQLTHVLIRLQDPQKLDEAVAALRGCDAGLEMNVIPLTHLFRSIQGLVAATRTLMGCILLVALLIAGAGVSNTVLMAVAERTREIGVLRSVGASSGQIFALVWLETLLICVSGGIVGLTAACLGAGGLESWLRARLPFAPTDALVRPEPWIMLFCLGGASLLGSLAGLLPAVRAARLSPIEAIRATI